MSDEDIYHNINLLIKHKSITLTSEQIDECVKIYNILLEYGPNHINENNREYDPPVDFFYFINFSVFTEFVKFNDLEKVKRSAILKPLALYMKNNRSVVKNEDELKKVFYLFVIDYVSNKDNYDVKNIQQLFSTPISVTQPLSLQSIPSTTQDVIDIPKPDDKENNDNNQFLKSIDETVSQIFPDRSDNFEQIYINKNAYETLNGVIEDIKRQLDNKEKVISEVASALSEVAAAIPDKTQETIDKIKAVGI